MSQTSRRVVITIPVAAVVVCLLAMSRKPEMVAAKNIKQASPKNVESDASTWFRGNIHTHSLWSDGDDYPEMIADWYKSRGYNFLCYTDHNVLPTVERWTDVLKNKGKQPAYDKLKKRFPEWTEERMRKGRLEVRLKQFHEVAAHFNDPGKFLLVQGEEITDRFQNRPVHMNATNIQSLLPPLGGNSVYEVMQNNVNAVTAQRERTKTPILIHLNHPNFGYGVTAEDLARVHGENFSEVYNGHPGVRNSGDKEHASTERIWDIVNTLRLTELELPMMYGLATDDGHNYHKIPSRGSEPGRGWVMVNADELSPSSLVTALEAGRFYSSSGVTLKTVSATSSQYTVAVLPESDVTYRIEFVGTRKGFDQTSKPILDKEGKPRAITRIYSDDVGETLATTEGTSATYKFAGDELYVRARVISSKKHPNPSEVGEFERAWTQPVRVSAK